MCQILGWSDGQCAFIIMRRKKITKVVFGRGFRGDAVASKWFTLYLLLFLTVFFFFNYFVFDILPRFSFFRNFLKLLPQVGSGARSEKIRTYNWKDSRCSDHRIGRNFPLPSFLSGSGLDDMISACITLDQQEMMAELAQKQRQGQEAGSPRG